MTLRSSLMMLMTLALAGCAGGYSGYPGPYYDDAYYDEPYYGGGFGYGYGSHFYDDHYYDDDHDRYFEPSRNVSCDRKRDICYDRYGPSYHATKRYLGEREANRAYKKYGDSVFLFSPRSGVSCDRRTKECSDGEWTAPERKKQIERGNVGSIGSGRVFDDDDKLTRRKPRAERMANGDDDVARPARRLERQQRNSDDDALVRRKPRAERMANDDDKARPARRVEKQQPRVRLNSGGDKPDRGGSGNACPPKGCTD